MRREDVHICISSLLNCKMHLQLHVYIEEYLYCATVESKVHFYICIAPVRDSLMKEREASKESFSRLS
jgi:hypothetical protein